MPENSALHQYQSSHDSEKQTYSRHTRNWRRVAFLRGGTFLISLVPLLLALNVVGGFSVPWLVLSGLLFLMFLAIAFVHESMNRQIRISRLLMTMHHESIARINRSWEDISIPDYQIPQRIQAVANDLDLFGPQSLFKLLAIPRTPLGIQTLADWIAIGADIDEIRSRQMAVDELKNQQSWRLEFCLRCEQLAASQSGPSQFVQWAESKNWLPRRWWLLWFCRLTAMASLVSIVLLAFGVLPLNIAGPILTVTITLNFFVSVFFAGAMHDIFNQISTHQDEISHYKILFREVGQFQSRSPFLSGIQRDLTGPSNDVVQHIDSLGLLNWLANIRRHGMLFIVYLMFEFLFMWDIHVLDRLECWKNRHGQNARGWFEALGKWEAILALSKLAHDQPDWNFPVVNASADGRAVVSCKRLGHPLMNDSRVCNDVEVGPPGTVLLVSGSNMSGKSTLLRSLGVNAILAQMGSVVCAAEMTMPPLHVETSMRIVDSLASGTSFFMAELNRLKEIVDQSQESRASAGPTLLFLLDEILQGTNSRERQIAVSHVVGNLIEQGAIGAISTHDLDLATTNVLKDACVPVHFTEQFTETNGKQKMTFDYLLRRGIAETTNALKLLELVGLTKTELDVPVSNGDAGV